VYQFNLHPRVYPFNLHPRGVQNMLHPLVYANNRTPPGVFFILHPGGVRICRTPGVYVKEAQRFIVWLDYTNFDVQYGHTTNKFFGRSVNSHDLSVLRTKSVGLVTSCRTIGASDAKMEWTALTLKPSLNTTKRRICVCWRI